MLKEGKLKDDAEELYLTFQFTDFVSHILEHIFTVGIIAVRPDG